LSTQITPNEGLDYLLSKVYVTGALTLIAYTNTADSLSENTVFADLTQPTASNGYTPLTLNGTWSFANGVATYQHPAGANTSVQGYPMWVATGSWSATSTGAAIVDLSVSKILHARDHTTPFVAVAAKRLEINISQLAGP
jgi:hypothetical protein